MHGAHSSRRSPRSFALVAGALALALSGVVGVRDAEVVGADPNLAAVSLGLAPITTALDTPVAIASRTGNPRLFVAEQGGRVRVVDPSTGAIVGTALTLTGIATGGERGLLGLTFSPDGTKLYVFFTKTGGALTVTEYAMAGDTAVSASARELLSIPHPLTNHNGGQIAFGPDGHLYIATGDGGGAGDPDGNAQNRGTLLGKILRIDPTPSGLLPYTIPPGNPFVGQPGVRPEIWMYGLRNPWRFSFDSSTGDMWIADVGQNAFEEVDYAPAGVGGQNWGWKLREGFVSFSGPQPPDGVDPLFARAHTSGWCSVIGGFVYRGSAIADLAGAYVYGDLCRGVLSGVVQSGGAVVDEIDFSVGVPQITTFGEDAAGELYVANLAGGLYKLVQAPPPSVSVGGKAILEGHGANRSLTFPVSLSQPANAPVSVQYTTAAQSATGGPKRAPGVDFGTKSGTITFNVNATGKTPISRTISVPVFGDTVDEGDETFTVTLSSPTGGYTLGRASATGTIVDDDPGGGVTLGVGDAAVAQQVNGAQTMSIPVTLSAATGAVEVPYTIIPGSATHSAKATLGGEFGGKLSGTVRFAAGATVRQITVPVWPDLIPDADHSFSVTLGAPTGGVSVVRGVGTGTLLDL